MRSTHQQTEIGMPLFNKPRLSRISFGNLFTKLLLLAMGFLFLLPSAYKLYTYGLFRAHAVVVDGVIVDASRGRDIGGRPFVEYKDQQGALYERKSKAKTHWFFAPQVGEKVRVFYDNRDPNKAIVDNTFHYILVPICFMAAGVYFLVSAFRK